MYFYTFFGIDTKYYTRVQRIITLEIKLVPPLAAGSIWHAPQTIKDSFQRNSLQGWQLQKSRKGQTKVIHM